MAQVIYRRTIRQEPRTIRPNLHGYANGGIAPMTAMTMAIGHLMLSGLLTPREARGVSTTRRPCARIIHAPEARRTRLENATLIVHTDNLAARMTRLADLDDMFALVRGVGLHALLAHGGPPQKTVS